MEKGFVPASDVDQAQATYDVARATLASAQERLNTIQPEQDADIKAQRARVHVRVAPDREFAVCVALATQDELQVG